MKISRRHFRSHQRRRRHRPRRRRVQSAFAFGFGETGAQAQAPAPASGGTHPALAALKPMTGGREADHEGRAGRARAEGAAADGREQDQRDLPRRRIEHVLFHRRALGPQRAAVRVRDSRAKGELAWVCARLRGGARARAGRRRPPKCACGRKTKARTGRSPASSRIAAPPAAASASKSGCASSSSTA